MGIVRRKNTTNKGDDAQGVSAVIADRVDVPPEVATRPDRLVEARCAVTVSAASRPDGANVELKPIDASGNPYLVAGCLIAAGLAGIERGLELPPERLRLFLALIVVAVAIRLAIGLTWRPAELFTVYGAT